MNTNQQKNRGKGKTRWECQAESGPGPGRGAHIPAYSGKLRCPTSDNKGLGRAIGKGDRGIGAGQGRKRRGRETSQGERGVVGQFPGRFTPEPIRKTIQKALEEISQGFLRAAYSRYQEEPGRPADRTPRMCGFFGGGNPDGDGGLLESGRFLEGKTFTRDGGLLESKDFVQVDFPGKAEQRAARDPGLLECAVFFKSTSPEGRGPRRTTRMLGIFGGLEGRQGKRKSKKQAGSLKPGTKATKKGGHGSRNEHYVNYDNSHKINHLQGFRKRDFQIAIMAIRQAEREYTLHLRPSSSRKRGIQGAFPGGAWEKASKRGIINRVAISSPARQTKTGKKTKAKPNG